jgi:GrpB-like predicted nucleotidyltransferase (UPF0157 family)
MADTPDHLSDEYLRSVTVGSEPPPVSGHIVLAEYDDNWPRLYAREAARIRGALGDAVLAVEHVGSTAVPGLAAKPVIDIDLIVADTTDEDAYVPALARAGYVLRIREPDWYEHRLFKGPDTNVNLHVFSPGCEEYERHLRFRDRLRTHPGDRDRYLTTKRDLAAHDWPTVNHYAEAKGATILEILARAAT